MDVAFRQGVQNKRVYQNERRLIKCSRQILPLRKINGNFAADRRIYLRKQRGGNLHIFDPPQKCSSRKAGKIADHTAAQRNEKIASGKTSIQKRLVNAWEIVEVLRFLTMWKNEVIAVKIFVQRGQDALSVEWIYAVI